MNDWYMKNGEWTITKPTNPDLYPTPYGLHHMNKIIGHFKTSKEAISKHKELING